MIGLGAKTTFLYSVMLLGLQVIAAAPAEDSGFFNPTLQIEYTMNNPCPRFPDGTYFKLCEALYRDEVLPAVNSMCQEVHVSKRTKRDAIALALTGIYARLFGNRQAKEEDQMTKEWNHLFDDAIDVYSGLDLIWTAVETIKEGTPKRIMTPSLKSLFGINTGNKKQVLKVLDCVMKDTNKIKLTLGKLLDKVDF